MATLVARNRRTAAELVKRERELAERERALLANGKRSRLSDGSSSSSNSRGDDEAAGNAHGSDDDMNDIFGIGGGGGDGAGVGGGRGGGNRGRDMTLRQLAISRFDELGYVDVKVFARNNLTARRPSKLNDILSSAEFIAAWASYNTELQKYLLPHHRVDDALMVTKYLGQLIRLLTDFPTQWQTVVTLDTHIRSSEYVEGPIVWTVDANDDEVSSFRTDIRLGHQLPCVPHLHSLHRPP
jgi:hypothetical protein